MTNSPTKSNHLTESSTHPTLPGEDVLESITEELLVSLAEIARRKKSLKAAEDLLLHDLTEALEAGHLDQYKGSGEKTYAHNGVRFSRVTRRKKVYSDEVKRQLDDKVQSIQADLDMIEYRATRLEQFEIKESQHWQITL